ncbi:hypothetical protein GS399_18840 [Pedobacter sp. HMF7647]|uniref:YokE-like PH domain-containing protein n=1 Tax=Hufsiella arboris TaxID=2695275 RepID=A0A7K1YEM1_9SPHI|nr:PH domain-containing protein [Hufsiella arboris]MXV53032.1 hypothetical protein [Hufsiella arboris]
MWTDQYLTDEQEPKTVEKVLTKLKDMLTGGESILYVAVQKKPAVTLIPDSIVITDKRIFFCIPGNLGLTTNFEIFSWKDLKEVSFKEEFFGAKFTAVPLSGENITTEYIPKVQARKLYQFSNQQLDKEREMRKQAELEEKRIQNAASIPVSIQTEPAPEPPKPIETPEDEMTQKLVKLKTLFEKQLITQEEYEQKKADILSQF